jgi:diguanylate cyclase (GGDEF)-like protein/putative nucleotidyltransferase with HDIG domain
VFGSRSRPPRPVLLVIVFGVLLALVGITATAQAAMVSVYASTSTLNAIVESDVATLRGFIHQGLDPGLVEGEGPSPAEADRLGSLLETLTSKGEIVRVELRRPDGTIVAASTDTASGMVVPPSEAFNSAIDGGTVHVAIVPAGEAEAGPGSLPAETVLREYLPLGIDGSVVLVVGVWRDAVPILGRLDDLRRDVVLLTLSAAIIAAVVLYLVFRSAQARITRQTEALLAASLRDPLTGTLNHGALVDHLAEQIEQARTDGGTLGVALIDVDNFRLLNANHGHAAGDGALLAVAGYLEKELPAGTVMGRYGPDEFLVVAPSSAVADLEPTIVRLRAALVDLSLQFESTERLPVTVSAGLCTFPEHGSSVTVLLATAAQTLEEAKAGGGDAIRVAERSVEGESGRASSFDVFQGLVFAVDTKDRYTKRHSEDVARYAIFLARRLGLEPEVVRTIQTAGLLHDIGKIGIPDAILRKPGRLTADEEAVVRQHVALGDMIVRELPDIDSIRTGIRHHHERWDGQGYLAGLRGAEIPLIARILAVGDAFSAMTTTRPYRKALDVREALVRLGDAAGSQLDEDLVQAFIVGIETAPDPPLPGNDARTATLWLPQRRVA